jgi:transposase-like protein
MADLARVQKIRDGRGFARSGQLSKLTRARNFLSSHGISFEGMDDEVLLRTWRREFRERSRHSEKIAAGRFRKHGDDEAIKQSDQARVIKGSCRRLGIEYRVDFSKEEKQRITSEAFKNFRVKDTLHWKLKHLDRHASIENVQDLSPCDIDRLYA